METTRTLCVALLALFCGACASTPAERSPAAGARTASITAADAGWMELVDMDGGRHDLGDALGDGRGVALVFWQSWCAACLRESPRVAAASRRLAGQVDFYGVVSGPDDVVDETAVTETSNRLALPYPQVRDRSGELARRFGVVGTPTIVVIEPSGRVSHNGHELPEAWDAGGAGR